MKKAGSMFITVIGINEDGVFLKVAFSNIFSFLFLVSFKNDGKSKNESF